MKKKKEIVGISFDFALKLIDLYKYLCSKNEFILSKQLLRSGTSIGANVNEAQAAQSKRDFIPKMSIASKEARETEYWLRLLKASGYLKDYSNTELLIENIKSIVNLLTSIVKSLQKNIL